MKPLIKLASGLLLLAAPVLADVSVHVDLGAPPPPRHEVIVASPGPDYVWVNGYWGGEPGHYSWVGGHWDRPPHRGSVWVSPNKSPAPERRGAFARGDAVQRPPPEPPPAPAPAPAPAPVPEPVPPPGIEPALPPGIAPALLPGIEPALLPG